MTMGNHRSTAPRDPRFAVWIGTTVVLFVAALLVGFVWLPSAQRGPGILCALAIGLQW
jgi:hypothetical protein